MWSTTAQRWSFGVLAAVLLRAAGASATGREGDRIDSTRFVDAAIVAPLTDRGPRSMTSKRTPSTSDQD